MIYRHPPQNVYRYDRFKLVVAVILVGLLFAAAWFLPQDKPSTTMEPAIIEIMPPVLLRPDAEQAVAPGAVKLSGRADPEAQVRISIDGTEAGTATADVEGKWQLTTQLEPGSHSLLLETLDAEGTVVATAPPVAIDVVAPTPVAIVPTINLPQGEIAPGTLALTGTADAGTDIVVLLNGEEVGSTTADETGSWTLPVELAAGQTTLTARALLEGTVVGEIEALAVAVPEPTPEPVEPAPEVILAEGTPLIEQPADGDEISAGTVAFSGTGLAGRTVSVVLGNTVVAYTQVNDSGSWSAEAEVTPGTHTAVVQSLDAEGRRVLSSPPLVFTAVDGNDS